jgi:hypothetical protein
MHFATKEKDFMKNPISFDRNQVQSGTKYKNIPEM